MEIQTVLIDKLFKEAVDLVKYVEACLLGYSHLLSDTIVDYKKGNLMKKEDFYSLETAVGRIYSAAQQMTVLVSDIAKYSVAAANLKGDMSIAEVKDNVRLTWAGEPTPREAERLEAAALGDKKEG